MLALALVLLVGDATAVALATSTVSCTVRPGTIPIDTDGNPVHAHGAGVYTEGDSLYLLGAGMKVPVPQDSSKPTDNIYYTSDSINLYTTTRSANALCRWRSLGAVLNRTTIESSMRPLLSPNGMVHVERPKLTRSASGQYVIWMHLQDSQNGSYSNVGIARAYAVTGPYTWSSNMYANGLVSKDSTVFLDPLDNQSYFVRDAAHHCDAISPLTWDGLSVGPLCSHTGPPSAPNICSVGCPSCGKAVTLCEGVAMFRDPIDSRLFMLGSHLSGWSANSAILFVSSQQQVCGTNSTPWTYMLRTMNVATHLSTMKMK
eukprot:COSAG03_NODE_4291_length_1605_cov_1.045153_2_plen_316_part_00